MAARLDGEGKAAKAVIDLQRYFPYRLAILAEQVSLAVAEVYARRFDMTRQEWRVLAVLGGSGESSASQIGQVTTLDKMQVSRAMQALEARGIIRRSLAAGDRRRRIITLSATGRKLYREIVPLALARETQLLAGLDAHELTTLDRIMAKIAIAAKS